jgi:hypothetical protein
VGNALHRKAVAGRLQAHSLAAGRPMPVNARPAGNGRVEKNEMGSRLAARVGSSQADRLTIASSKGAQ